MNLNVEYFFQFNILCLIYQLANPLRLYNHPSRRLARSLHIPRHTFDSLKLSMGSQGKARYLTIIVLIVTIILLSCSNLAVTTPKAPCKYDPKDGKCKVGEPAAATKFDGGRS
ncbi:hypothetical protein NC652_038812 [Populus alba x Populus x berolinensis]|uniref:Uncharacterized protein n=1 Tax=Populus alba x Populus x berolinensis TaxID=444605 RepID=A0AAD6PTT1_9ROSI|nr:hypothetical protein NC652_038812 [Populus alba x Populus x berolinensis]KAJ6960850.1 hypothetical protein NC653_038761 [Populus alba x Populus x berolinensis]